MLWFADEKPDSKELELSTTRPTARWWMVCRSPDGGGARTEGAGPLPYPHPGPGPDPSWTGGFQEGSQVHRVAGVVTGEPPASRLARDREMCSVRAAWGQLWLRRVTCCLREMLCAKRPPCDR